MVDPSQPGDPGPVDLKRALQQAQKQAPEAAVRAYTQPRPWRWLMDLSKPIVRYPILCGLPGLRRLPWIGRLSLLRGLAWIDRVDLADVDLRRLREAVHADSAALMAPNHPELFTDWMLDVEIFGRVAPYFAAWATPDVVNGPLKPLWVHTNLIPATPGGEGKAYSVDWALAGHGTLIHPEGEVRWQGDHILPLYPGVLRLALQVARRARETDDRPVWIVPAVWKLAFVVDVSRALGRELAELERRLGLPVHDTLPPAPRFVALLCNLQLRQERHFELDAGGLAPGQLFARQRALRRHLLGQIKARLGLDEQGVRDWRRARLRRSRALQGEVPGTTDWAREAVAELTRLDDFSQAAYGGPVLSQEHIAESLKRLRFRFFKRGLWDAIRNTVPPALGPRRVRVGVLDPIDVGRLVREGPPATPESEALFLQKLRGDMQARLDAINEELRPLIQAHAVDNPFVG